MRNIYLDHCATTPVRPEVFRAMVPFLKGFYGNPSSLHDAGRVARDAVEAARRQVAELIGASPSEIVFTSGGTEANNLAIQGTVDALGKRGNHIITTAIEHHSVLRTCEGLERRSCKVTYLPVDRWGLVEPGDVSKAVTSKTVLITIMHGNNEIGTLEPIKDIQKIATRKNILFHTDGVQTVGKIPIDVKDLAIDLLSMSAHKIYGPKGIGALYIREGVPISPLFFGGHQEKGFRSGTENVAAIVGMGKACDLSRKEITTESDRLAKLRDLLQERILSGIKNSVVNGHPEKRLRHILSISVPNLSGEDMVRDMDKMGIAASSGSACTSRSIEISHVISALGLSRETAKGTVRFSLGRKNTRQQIEKAAEAFLAIVEKRKALSDLEESLGSRRCI